MSKCESNVNELIVPGLVGIPGTVSSRLAEYRDWRGDVQADVSDLETCASNLEIQGLAITAIDFVNPCARYSEVSFELGDDAIHARLIEPVGRARVSERVPLCLMFHDIDRPVRGWHHMTRFAAMGYAVLALDDDVAGADDLQRGISSPAFVERVRWGCALAKVARNLDGMDPDRIFVLRLPVHRAPHRWSRSERRPCAPRGHPAEARLSWRGLRCLRPCSDRKSPR